MSRPRFVPTAPAPLIRLRAKRIARGYTLQELSTRSGVSLNNICGIERRRRIASETELGALAVALDVDPPSALLDEVTI